MENRDVLQAMKEETLNESDGVWSKTVLQINSACHKPSHIWAKCFTHFFHFKYFKKDFEPLAKKTSASST